VECVQIAGAAAVMSFIALLLRWFVLAHTAAANRSIYCDICGVWVLTMWLLEPPFIACRQADDKGCMIGAVLRSCIHQGALTWCI
jgi:hypothetical protein